jgi:hypothetical protein
MIIRAIPRVLVTALMAVLLNSVSSAQYRKIDPAQQQKIAYSQQYKVDIPGPLQLLIMIKTTLIAFNDANASGNYTVLRDLASLEFQQTNTSANLAKTFERERERKVDISPIVLLQPTLLRPAFIDDSGLLWLVGFFSSTPTWVNFKLAFKPVAGRWRLEALGVLTGENKVASSSGRNAQSVASDETVRQPGPAVNEIVRGNWPTEAIRTPEDYGGYFGLTGRDSPSPH